MSKLQPKWSPTGLDKIYEAIREAKRRGHAELEPEHLVFVDLRDEKGVTAHLARETGVSRVQIEQRLDEALCKFPVPAGLGTVVPKFSQQLRVLVEQADNDNTKAEALEWRTVIQTILLSEGRIWGLEPERLPGWIEAEQGLDDSGMGVIFGSDALEEYCVDLTELASQGKLTPVIGREGEVREVLTVLAQKGTNNPLLLGEPGVGKTAIVEGIAQRIEAGTISFLLGKKLLALDVGALMAGASYRGELEERLKKLIHEIRTAKGNIVMFVDELHTLMGAGDPGGGPDLANLLKPALARGELHMIGATTYGEYRLHFSRDPAFARRFQRVDVQEPTLQDTKSILAGVQASLERHHGVRYEKAVLDSVLKLSQRFLADMRFPDKAVKVLDRAAARLVIARAEGVRADDAVVCEDVEAVIADMADLPLDRISDQRPALPENLAETLAASLIGQEPVIHALVRRLRLTFSGLGTSDRPRGILLFTGQSGVGKTEAARILARTLYPHDRHFLPINMAELSDSQSISHLKGAAPGLVGYEEGGMLTDSIWRTPDSLILLDDCDLAHGRVLDLFQQIFEHGRLTDNKGRTVHFGECLFVLTTSTPNTGGLSRGFLSRLDEIFSFSPLTAKHVPDLADLIVTRFAASFSRLAWDQAETTIHLTDAVLADLCENGLSSGEGARGLRRYMENRLFGAMLDHQQPASYAGKQVTVDHDGTIYHFAIKKGG